MQCIVSIPSTLLCYSELFEANNCKGAFYNDKCVQSRSVNLIKDICIHIMDLRSDKENGRRGLNLTNGFAT